MYERQRRYKKAGRLIHQRRSIGQALVRIHHADVKTLRQVQPGVWPGSGGLIWEKAAKGWVRAFVMRVIVTNAFPLIRRHSDASKRILLSAFLLSFAVECHESGTWVGCWLGHCGAQAPHSDNVNIIGTVHLQSISWAITGFTRVRARATK